MRRFSKAYAVILAHLLIFSMIVIYNNQFFQNDNEIITGISLRENLEMNVTIPSVKRNNKKTLNLVFYVNPDPVDRGGRIFETDWIQNVVFGGLDRPVRVITDPPLYKFYNDSVSVFLFRPPYVSMFPYMRRHGYVNVGAYHMGDENASWDISYYNSTDFVFRNYFYPNRTFENSSYYLPVGYKSGLAFKEFNENTSILAPNRTYLCNFVGSMRSSRQEAINSISYKRNQCFLSSTKVWADPRGLSSIRYRQVLYDSKFTITPPGNNQESLRFYEALEAGSIPIVQDDETFISMGLNKMYGDGRPVPLPRISNWTAINQIFEYYDSNPEEMLKLQLEVMNWWKTIKTNMQLKVKQVIDAGFEKYYGYS